MRRWWINTIISLLIGGAFLWVAARDWRIKDIVDCLQPLPTDQIWVVSDPPQQAATTGVLFKDGTRIAEVPLGPGAASVKTPGISSAAGVWTLKLPAGTAIQGWSLAFRPSRSGGEADPFRFAAPEGAGPAPIRVTEVRWLLVLPFILLFFVLHSLRVLRWGVLMRPLVDLSFRRVLAVCSVGYMAIIILPLRLGEFVRPYLVTRDGADFTGALGACAVERILDGLTVTGLLFVSFAYLKWQGIPIPPTVYAGGYVAAAVFVSALLLLLLGWWRRDLAQGLIRFCGRPFPARVTTTVEGLVNSFLDGVGAIPNAPSVAAIIAYTVGFWTLNALSFWITALAVGLTDPSGQPLSYLAMTAVLMVLAIGIIVPAGPGFAGNYEAAARLGLSLFIAEELLLTRGAAFILLVHGLTLLLQGGIGFVFLLAGDTSLRSMIVGSQDAAAPDAPDP